MAWWNQTYVSVSRVTFRRFMMLAEEVYFLEYEDELTDTGCRNEAEKIIQKVLDEYIRQHFEESTKEAVKMAVSHQPKHRLI